MRKGFSLLELIFVIILIALLAAVAIPRLMASRMDAKAARILEDINTVRKEIVGYTLSQGTVKSDISQMSPAARKLIEEGLAHEDPYKLYIKVTPDDEDCVYFEIRNEDGYKLYLLLGPSQSEACKIVQEHVYVVDYPINLSGAAIYGNSSTTTTTQ